MVQPSALIPDVNALYHSETRPHRRGVREHENLPALLTRVRRELPVEPRHLFGVDEHFVTLLRRRSGGREGGGGSFEGWGQLEAAYSFYFVCMRDGGEGRGWKGRGCR